MIDCGLVDQRVYLDEVDFHTLEGECRGGDAYPKTTVARSVMPPSRYVRHSHDESSVSKSCVVFGQIVQFRFDLELGCQGYCSCKRVALVRPVRQHSNLL
jgi:hypothetical protein